MNAIEKRPSPRELLQEMASLGLMGVNVPAELGGAEAGVVAYALAIIEVAAALRFHRGDHGGHQHVRRAHLPFRHATRSATKYVPRPHVRRRGGGLLRAVRAAGGFRPGGASDQRRPRRGRATSSTAPSSGSPAARMRA